MGRKPPRSAWLAELAAGAPRGIKQAGARHALRVKRFSKEKEYGKFPKFK